MSKNIKKIQDGIRELGKSDAYEVYTGQVDSIDANNQCCDVEINDGLVIPQVRLKMAMGSDVGMYVLPKKGSFCVIAKMDGGVDYCMLQCSEIDKQWMKIGDITFDLTKDGLVLNGGNNKGMVITDKAVERWNAIEDSLNDLKTIFAGWTPVAQDGGAALKGSISTWAGQQLVKTKDTDVKNDKVKH